MNFGRGIVRAFDAATGLATVEVVGGHSGYLVMPALTGLSAANMTAGRRCLLVFFDERNPTDGCVVGTYDAAADVLSVDGLSGVLADAQNAGWLVGRELDSTAPIDGQVLTWDNAYALWSAKAPASGYTLDTLATQTSAANNVNWQDTDLSITLAVAAGQCIAFFLGGSHKVNTGTGSYQLLIDGVVVWSSSTTSTSAARFDGAGISYALSAGNIVCKLQFHGSTGSGYTTTIESAALAVRAI